MKKIFIILFSFFLMSNLTAQKAAKSAEHIQWLTMNEALKKSEKNPKKILVDFYTDWCGWCKKMDQATYENPEIVKEINKNYYAVKFNAEKGEPITYKGKEYKLTKQGVRQIHELAVALLQGKMGYPSTAILNNNQDLIQTLQGYIEAEEMSYILQYFTQDKHMSMPYNEFRAKN